MGSPKRYKRMGKNKPHYFRILIVFLFFIIFLSAACFGIFKGVNFIISKVSTNNDSATSSTETDVNPTPIIQDTTINITAIGDIMCHSTNFKAAYDSSTGTYDFSSVFRYISTYTQKADLTIRKS